MTTYQEFKQEVRENFIGEYFTGDDERTMEMLETDEPHDYISECADGNVPIYNQDILELVANCAEFRDHKNSLPPAFDGHPTIINIAATTIYEAAEEILWELWEELKAAWQTVQDANPDYPTLPIAEIITAMVKIVEDA